MDPCNQSHRIANFLRCAMLPLATFLMLVASSAFGKPGDLDTTFGGGTGRVESVISPTSRDQARGVAIQTDGKIVVAGTCPVGSFTGFCVVRYLTDGTIDTNYGDSGGLTASAIGARNATVSFALLQADGKFVVIGSCEVGSAANVDFCVARYTSSGLLDTTFNTTGFVITNTGNAIDEASHAALQADGKIVVVGTCRGTKANVCVVRYNANGTADSAFGNSGRVITAFSVSADDIGNAVALQADGKIVVTGQCNFIACLARYLPTDGTLDTSFDGDGKLIDLTLGFSSSRGGVVIQNDGKIVLLTTWVQSGTGGGSEGSFLLKRYLTNGSTDATFGDAGVSRFDHTRNVNGGAPDDAHMLAIQSLDGKFLIAGTCEVQSTRYACVARANNDGSPDLGFGVPPEYSVGVNAAGFGKGGKSYDTQANVRAAYALALQPDGKIVSAGVCGLQFFVNSENFCVERRLGGPAPYRQCSLDIDGDGVVNATTDSLIHARIALGMSGATVLNGINLSGKPRSTWTAVRDYLNSQCGMSLTQ
jgi:uncharacterized delta-60 repeat protein